tara:strand:- start:48 stop:476 length:429 start_codon:yes stop_codon:yes gene_type:complete
MPHILENKSLGFLLMVLLLALVISNTGLLDFMKQRENFTDDEKNFLRSLVNNDEGNGAATKANNANVQKLLSSMGKKEITPSGTAGMGGMGGMNMQMIKSMKDFLTQNGSKMKDMVMKNGNISAKQKEQFSQAMNLVNKLNI